jgi:glucose-1-phosphate cytidylyltransferase|tara:strand:+ start:627 stop:1391 length:765 start_codon:yes stop_codon:yes gene_type:complete
MKVVILAGGFGTRLSEYTESIPKPMVTIGGFPMIWHIMKYYAAFGHKEFFLALGYKAEIIKQYFHSLNTVNSDFTINLIDGGLEVHNKVSLDWKVTLIDTGLDTMTGGRIKRLQSYVGDNPFMLTYGDGIANIDLSDLKSFHEEHNKMVSVTAVRPVARFGELALDGSIVTSFQEKPQVTRGWINGGFFICQPDVFDLIEGDHTVWEGDPLEKISELKELRAFKHEGFWQCMDTKRDRDYLEDIWRSQNVPWKA